MVNNIATTKERIAAVSDDVLSAWYNYHPEGRPHATRVGVLPDIAELKALAADHNRLETEHNEVMQFFGIEKTDDGEWKYTPASMRKFRTIQKDKEYDRLHAENDELVAALEGLTSEAASIVTEVAQGLQERDFMTPQEFMEGEGTNGHSRDSMMRAYSDYVLDQTVNTLRFLNCVNGMRTRLDIARAALDGVNKETI